jgi:hypothetical protein
MNYKYQLKFNVMCDRLQAPNALFFILTSRPYSQLNTLH